MPALSFIILKKRRGNARRVFLIYQKTHEKRSPRFLIISLAALAALATPPLLSLDIPAPLTRRSLLVLTAAHPSHSLSPPPFPRTLQIRGPWFIFFEVREKTAGFSFSCSKKLTPRKLLLTKRLLSHVKRFL